MYEGTQHHPKDNIRAIIRPTDHGVTRFDFAGVTESSTMDGSSQLQCTKVHKKLLNGWLTTSSVQVLHLRQPVTCQGHGAGRDGAELTL